MPIEIRVQVINWPTGAVASSGQALGKPRGCVLDQLACLLGPELCQKPHVKTPEFSDLQLALLASSKRSFGALPGEMNQRPFSESGFEAVNVGMSVSAAQILTHIPTAGFGTSGRSYCLLGTTGFGREPS